MTVLELLKGPLSLSKLSVSVEKRLSPMVLEQVERTLNRAFSHYERSFKEMADGGVEGVARERERLEAATEHAVNEVDRLDDRLNDRTVGVVGRLGMGVRSCIAHVRNHRSHCHRCRVGE